MRDEIRERWFTPFILPVTVIGIMLLIGMSLSRILLAVSELGAAFVALLAAGYIMVMAFFVEARTRITARALGIAMAVGLVGLVGAGTVAAAAGMRPIEEHGAEAGGEGGEGGEGASNEPVFVAIDIAYESAPSELAPGTEVTLENEGTIEHNVVIEETDTLLLDADGGETDTATLELEQGEYTYFCDVAGHREAGMEGTLTVSDSAGAGSGGEASSEEVSSEAGSEAGAASEGTSESAAAASEG